MALATLADFEERLNISGTNPSDKPDAYLTNLLDRATSRINAMVGRTLEQATFTEYYDGTGTSYLELRQGPISSVTSVSSIEYDTDGNETATALSVGNYFIRGTESDWLGPGYLEMNSSSWTPGQRNYKVIYVAGFSPVPDDLSEACMHLAVGMLNRRKDTATSSRDLEGGSMAFRGESAVINEVRQMLRPYMDVRVPS